MYVSVVIYVMCERECVLFTYLILGDVGYVVGV